MHAREQGHWIGKKYLHQLTAGTCHLSSGGSCAWRRLLPAACCAGVFSARHSTLLSASAAAPAWPFAALFAPRALTDPEGWLESPDGPACAPDVPFMAAAPPPCPDGPASPTGPGCPPWVATRFRYRRYFCKWLATFSRVSPSTCMISRIFLGTASARKRNVAAGASGCEEGVQALAEPFAR